jgi:hypothetical protein
MESEKTEVREFVESVERGHSNIIEVGKSLLADGREKIVLELTQKVDPPVRRESPRRAHTFFDPAGFAGYLAENKPADGRLVVLIDTDALVAKAVLDDGAKDGFEVIAFRPPYHPIFKLIKTALLKTQTVREFADGAVRCRPYIVGMDGHPADGQQLAMLMRQITVSNEVTCESGAGNHAVNGVMVRTSVKAGTTIQTQIDLPESLTLRTPIFLCGEAVEMTALLSVVPISAERAAISAEVTDLEVIIHEQFDRMLEELHQMPGAQVSFGQIAHADWAYVG